MELHKNDTLDKFQFLDSSLPLNERLDNLLSLMTIDEKISILPTHQAAIPRLNVNEYNVGGEAAHGIVTPLGASTIFPQPIGLASTFNKNLLKKIGSVIGDEARAYYNVVDNKHGLTRWAPTIDMERDPRWGRTEEAYGEDPHLTGELSLNLVKGMQGDDPFYLKFVPAPKHFYGNNNEEGRIWCSSSIDSRNKNEYYLKAFEPAFTKGKAKSMMTAYNSINGTPCIVNKEVQEIVKDKWGCDGFIVCDGGDFSQTVEYHKYYETHAETIAGALKAGIDCFTDAAELVIKSTKEALERNLITEEDINKAVKNIFSVRFRLGEFDSDELNPYSKISLENLCSKEHNNLALQACKESIVLLKNENNFLPLKEEKINSMAIIGPLADVIYKDWYCGNHPYKITPLQGFKNRLKSKKVNFHNGNDTVKINCIEKEFPYTDTFQLEDWGFNNITLKNTSNAKYLTINEDDESISCSADDIWGWFVKEVFKVNDINADSFKLNTWNGEKIDVTDNKLNIAKDTDFNEYTFTKDVIENGIEEAKKLASSSDVAVVVVGNHPLINGKEEIDRTDLILPPHQEALIKAVYETNPNTVVVIVGSYPFAIKWCDENITAILYCSHGCQELGTALAECILGDYSPSGRLPMTWYKSVNDLPPIMDYDIINGNRTYMYFDGKPLYPFGHGLTYTKFKYRNLIVGSHSINDNEEIDVEFILENSGDVISDEVVQMYVSLNSSRVKRPTKQLVHFERVTLNAGDCKWITFKLNSSDLKYYDVDSENFFLENGNCLISIGSSSSDIRLKKVITVNGSDLPPRDLTNITKAENYDSYLGVILDECSEGGTCVTPNTSKNSWIQFSDVNFNGSQSSIDFKVLCSEESEIEIKIDSIDGLTIGKSSIDSTDKWVIATCCISELTGIHDLFIIMNGSIKISTLKFGFV